MKQFYVFLLGLICMVLSTMPVEAGSRIRYRTLNNTTTTYLTQSNTQQVYSIAFVNPSSTTVVYDMFYTSATSYPGLVGANTVRLSLMRVVATAGETTTVYLDDYKYYNIGVYISTACTAGSGNYPLNNVQAVLRVEE